MGSMLKTEIFSKQRSVELLSLVTSLRRSSFFIGTLSEFCEVVIIFSNLKYTTMLRWTITFLIIAIIAAILGFGGIAAGAAGIAKVLFFIFIVLFLLSLIRGRSTL